MLKVEAIGGVRFTLLRFRFSKLISSPRLAQRRLGNIQPHARFVPQNGPKEGSMGTEVELKLATSKTGLRKALNLPWLTRLAGNGIRAQCQGIALRRQRPHVRIVSGAPMISKAYYPTPETDACSGKPWVSALSLMTK